MSLQAGPCSLPLARPRPLATSESLTRHDIRRCKPFFFVGRHGTDLTREGRATEEDKVPSPRQNESPAPFGAPKREPASRKRQ